MRNNLDAILKNYKPKPLGQQQIYAVLLPLVYQEGEWQVLYQVRSEGISQPGEVSFPGGGVKTGETLKDAAIRETVEELNVKQSSIEILGEIDYLVSDYRTIYCFVGRLHVSDWRSIQPNEEVAKLFTISLETLLERPPKYYQLSTKVEAANDFPFDRLRDGVNYRFNHSNREVPFYDLSGENLWGITAQFTARFTEIIKEQEQWL